MTSSTQTPIGRGRPRRVVLGVSLALFLPASTAFAQTPAVAAACDSVTDAATLNTTLPLELLDYIEKISSSAFVHAFLVSYVAETGNPQHGLTGCVTRFLDAEPKAIPVLRQNRVTAGTLIRALRTAEQARVREEQLRATVRVSMDTVIDRLRQKPEESSLDVYRSLLTSAEGESCARTGQVCAAVQTLRTAIGRLRMAQDTLSVVQAQKETFGQQLATARSDMQLKRGRAEGLSTHLDTVTAALSAARTDTLLRNRLRADSASVGSQLVDARTAESKQASLLVTLEDTLVKVEGRVAAGTATVRQALAKVSTALNAFQDELQKVPTLRAITLQVPQRQQVRTSLALAPPAAVVPNPIQRDRSASMLIELTDFVIDRAKQEVVLSYLATLYRAMERDTLLRYGFPNTYDLMRGLTVADSSRLSVVAAGRIPLTVWRATLKNDFHSLPINLVQAPDPFICKEIQDCRLRVAQLRPIAAVVQRLVQGQPVLEVIRDAPFIASELSQKPTRDWNAFLQGLKLLAAIAETYHVQGLALNADPLQHPYILSLSALSGDQRRLDAFVRVLLLRILPESETQFEVDARPLIDAARRSTAAVEAIATAMQSNGPAVEQARQVLGAAVAALRAADGTAALFSKQTAGTRPGIRQFFLTVAEPLVVRDYALAMAQTAVLLRELTGEPVSANLLTLASLASSLAEAQSGPEMRAALETASSPVGGWQAKRYREGRRTSITAFPGAALGGEWMKDGPYSRTAGVTLPIGAEFQLLPRSRSASVAPGCFVFCSAGAFLSVVDLGALLSYRLKDSDTVKSEPNTGFRQVFAPGLYLTLGLGHTAFALLAGGQFMPGAREVAEDSGLSGNVWRAGAALTVDVMLFSF